MTKTHALCFPRRLGTLLLATLLALLLGASALLTLPALAAPAATGTPAATAVTPVGGTAMATPAATGAVTPAAPGGPDRPSAERGGAVYAENCADCHGAAGAGDGPSAAQLVAERGAPLPDFTSLDQVFTATPELWLDVITNGRMNLFMPPWKQTLTDEQIRDAAYFLVTLSVPEERLQAGQAVYAENCVRCHGPEGQGDGPDSSGDLPDFSRAEALAAMSKADVINALATKHASLASLSPQEQSDVADAVRALGYEYAPPPAAPEATRVQVSGPVINGTAGAGSTWPLTMTIYSFDHAALSSQAPEPTHTFTGTLTGDHYSEEVEVPDGGILLATVQYRGIYYRNYTVLESGAITATLPITIYESTEDPVGLSVQQMHVVVEPADATSVSGLEVVALTNTADRTFSGTLQFTLPAGVTEVDFPQSAPGQYTAGAGGFSGNTVVRPDAGSQVMVTFKVPVIDGALHVEQTVPFAANSVIVIALNTVEVSGAGLQPMTLADLPQEYRAYDAGALEKGATLAFDGKLLPGATAGTGTGTGSGGTTPSGLTATFPFLANLPPWAPYALGAALLLLVVGIVGWVWQRTHSGEDEYEYDEEDDEDEADEDGDGDDLAEEADAAPSREQLLQDIADLDDAYEAGDLSAGEYKRQRAALKAQLTELDER